MEESDILFRTGCHVDVNLPWPNIFRTSSAHEEGGIREYSISTRRFSGENGCVKKLEAVRVEMVQDSQGRLSWRCRAPRWR